MYLIKGHLFANGSSWTHTISFAGISPRVGVLSLDNGDSILAHTTAARIHFIHPPNHPFPPYSLPLLSQIVHDVPLPA